MSNLAVLNQKQEKLPLPSDIRLGHITEHRNALIKFAKAQMKQGVDYGKIPGTPKPTLFKAGAEKLLTLYDLSAEFELVESHKDWHEGFFYFEYRCRIKNNEGRILATCDASCHTKEKKYASGRTSAYDLVNTVQKMSQKRSLVGGILIAVNASEFFTQDLEELQVIEAEFEPVQAAPPALEPSNIKNPNADTIRSVIQALCIENRETVQALGAAAIENTFAGRKTAELNQDELNEYLAKFCQMWSLTQQCFSNDIECLNAWNKFVEQQADLAFPWLAGCWKEEILRRQREEVPV